MNSRDFCYWLQGYFELTGSSSIEGEKIQIVKNHLAMVFHHEIDPSFGDKKKQEELGSLHGTYPGGAPLLARC